MYRRRMLRNFRGFGRERGGQSYFESCVAKQGIVHTLGLGPLISPACGRLFLSKNRNLVQAPIPIHAAHGMRRFRIISPEFLEETMHFLKESSI